MLQSIALRIFGMNLVAAALELTHHSEKIACWRAPIKYGRAALPVPMEIATKALAALMRTEICGIAPVSPASCALEWNSNFRRLEEGFRFNKPSFRRI